MPPSAGACQTTDASENPDWGLAGERSSIMTAMTCCFAAAGETGMPSSGAAMSTGVGAADGAALPDGLADAEASADSLGAPLPTSAGLLTGPTSGRLPNAPPTNAPARATPTTATPTATMPARRRTGDLDLIGSRSAGGTTHPGRHGASFRGPFFLARAWPRVPRSIPGRALPAVEAAGHRRSMRGRLARAPGPTGSSLPKLDEDALMLNDETDGAASPDH